MRPKSTRLLAGVPVMAAAATGLFGAWIETASAQTAPAGAVALAAHRAVYEMSLGDTRSGSSVTSVKGRMVYELTGSACEGYTQNMRFVTEMATQGGEPTVTDLRSSTWEDHAAQLFRFSSTQFRDQKPTENTIGDAKRAGPQGDIAVELTKPEKKQFTLAAGTYFPVQHSIALLLAAKAGRTVLRADLYDGSEKGTKAYDTSARIGKIVAAGGNAKLPQVKNGDGLDKLPSWPVTISYYEKGKDGQDATPVYELGFQYFENGVSRRLIIDYGDFSIKGDIREITYLDMGKCDVK